MKGFFTVTDDLSYKQTAALIRVHPRTLRRMIDRNLFPPPYRVNPTTIGPGKLAFRRELVIEWLRVFRDEVVE